ANVLNFRHDDLRLFRRKLSGNLAAAPCLHRIYYDAGLHFPAMLAKVISPDDQAVNLHQTFLTPDGEKAAVERPRKMMPGTVPLGSAVRLMPAGSVLGVGEGIETVLAAARLFRVPVWSTLNAANLEAFREPAGVEELIVFG